MTNDILNLFDHGKTTAVTKDGYHLYGFTHSQIQKIRACLDLGAGRFRGTYSTGSKSSSGSKSASGSK